MYAYIFLVLNRDDEALQQEKIEMGLNHFSRLWAL